MCSLLSAIFTRLVCSIKIHKRKFRKMDTLPQGTRIVGALIWTCVGINAHGKLLACMSFLYINSHVHGSWISMWKGFILKTSHEWQLQDNWAHTSWWSGFLTKKRVHITLWLSPNICCSCMCIYWTQKPSIFLSQMVWKTYKVISNNYFMECESVYL